VRGVASLVCEVLTNVGQAVDAILDGTAYHVQRRIRNPESGTIQLKHETI
jgi:hypothetical protein